MSTETLIEIFNDISKELDIASLDKKEKQIVVKATELYHKYLICKSESSFLALNHQVKGGNL